MFFKRSWKGALDLDTPEVSRFSFIFYVSDLCFMCMEMRSENTVETNYESPLEHILDPKISDFCCFPFQLLLTLTLILCFERGTVGDF